VSRNWRRSSSGQKRFKFNDGSAAGTEAARNCSSFGKMGFVEVRQRGSHKQYRHADGRCTTVPFHGSRDISPFLLRQIIKDIRLTPDDFLDQLR
jgi:predicted RNA binding protein YcfA (HicA-like mRNA interferase family)